ncbi:MAG: hypothetical protein JJU36_08250 [Phycisphaeraceae bacterium]|nr:hypothetical protein [Phycisphaeraceae bacterium]
MSWFSSKPRKTFPKTRSRSSPSRRSSGSRRTGPDLPWRAVGKWSVLLSLLLGTLWLTGWGAGRVSAWMQGHVRELAAHKPEAEHVKLLNCPLALEHPVRARLKHLAAIALNSDPLDGANLGAVAEVVEVDPWIERVNSVRRVHGRVLIEAEYRLPFAWVKDQRGGISMVDRVGHVLWRHDDPDRVERLRASRPELGVITGELTSPPEEGAQWGSDRLGDALELLAYLADWEHFEKIRAVDIRGDHPSTRRLRMELLMAGGGGIVWGSAPGREIPMEVPAAQKLRRISDLEGRNTDLIFRDGSRWAVDLHAAIQKLPPRR